MPTRAPTMLFGHIIEMTPPDGDHAADSFAWDILVRCGDPRDPRGEVGALWNPATSDEWLVRLPRQCLRRRSRAGCGSPPIRAITGRAPAAPTASMRWRPRARGGGPSKLFFRVPVGAEMCGPCFTPDQETLFLAVQHPGADGTEPCTASAGRRPSRTRRRAGRISGRIGRRGPRCSPSPRSAAARSPDRPPRRHDS